jgi:tRNA-modifying protein YgfZ
VTEDRRGVAAPAGVDALERGAAFALLGGWRVLAVRGADARAWLHDLVTVDVATLQDGRARRSLILTPTGRIRADVHVGAAGGSFLLLQDPVQAEPVARILAPYVLSSDVELVDRTEDVEVVAVLGGEAAEDGDDAVRLEPSVLGSGRTVVVPAGDPARALGERLRGLGLADVAPADVETWRIRRGTARIGVDVETDALPAEAGLEDTIDFTKGCFLGQESVAKVRNLGHPPRLLVAVRSASRVEPGTPVFAGGELVGAITSAVEVEGGSVAIARVRWEAAARPLEAEGAGSLSLR